MKILFTTAVTIRNSIVVCWNRIHNIHGFALTNRSYLFFIVVINLVHIFVLLDQHLMLHLFFNFLRGRNVNLFFKLLLQNLSAVMLATLVKLMLESTFFAS